MEKCLRQSLDDLQLSYVDMYLIHTPFSVPETDGDFKRHANGDVVLDVDTNHIETWKVMRYTFAGMSRDALLKFQLFYFVRKWKKWSRLD